MLAALPLTFVMAMPAAAGFDVDDVGLSALERAAVVERARSELSVISELVDAPGLVECSADSPEASARGPSSQHADCAREVMTSVGAVAGASVRVVKVLRVVRVELVVLDRTGAVVASSTRTLDVEGAAKGPLFDEDARRALAKLAPRADASARMSEAARGDQPSPSRSPSPSSTTSDTETENVPYAAVGVGVGGALLALVGGAFAANEALLANSPSSSGDEKERARLLGPVAVGVSALGVAVAIGAPIALGLIGR